jgi:hypothetical protein
MAFNVLPLGPINLYLLFTNFSLFLTKPPIFIISTNILSSCIILIAYGNGTERAKSFIKSLALMIL